jgi:hypothetical protein
MQEYTNRDLRPGENDERASKLKSMWGPLGWITASLLGLNCLWTESRIPNAMWPLKVWRPLRAQIPWYAMKRRGFDWMVWAFRSKLTTLCTLHWSPYRELNAPKNGIHSDVAPGLNWTNQGLTHQESFVVWSLLNWYNQPNIRPTEVTSFWKAPPPRTLQ